MSEDSQNEGLDEMGGEVDDKLITNGWSITVGDLKAALSTVPDDYEVMLTCADVDEIDISNVNIDRLYPPSLGSNGLLVLGGGQILNSEYAYHVRMDVDHQIGTTSTWDERRLEWVKH